MRNNPLPTRKLQSSALSPALCRAARGLLDWTQEELAERADVSRSTVRDFEKERHGLQAASAEQIVAAFDKAGVLFVAADGVGRGVRLRGL
ncbi:helix-turn-helix transcriptional regulator [uncultured Enterovirga sp.]|uniref:helix-turn-helix transcriptional regulator n=1 Tax=uncultured Enterovirga sp. TaxID=2026352 RepID=UPI0035CA3018